MGSLQYSFSDLASSLCLVLLSQSRARFSSAPYSLSKVLLGSDDWFCLSEISYWESICLKLPQSLTNLSLHQEPKFESKSSEYCHQSTQVIPAL